MDSESIKKMLRAVLQSSKAGVPISSVQSEYRSLCGENIPLKKLGFSKLEDFLRSIPSVVRLENCKGELSCFAAVCQETAHIAELVAKQKSSKKSGHSQVVNCKMRYKPSNPYLLSVRPRSSLRQPSALGNSNWIANRSCSRGGTRGFSASGDYRKLDQKLSSITPVEHRVPTLQPAVKQCALPEMKERNFANCQKPQEKPPENVKRPKQSESGLYSVELMQSRLAQVLEKYRNGLWMSKLSDVYSNIFSQKLHPQVLIDLTKWTHICMVERTSSSGRADCLIYPPLPPKPSTVSRCSTPSSPSTSSIVTTPVSSPPSTPDQQSAPLLPFPVAKPPVSPQSLLARPTFVFPRTPAAPSSVRPTSSSTLCKATNVPRAPLCVDLKVNANRERKDLKLNHQQNAPASGPNRACPGSASAPSQASPLQPGPDILPLLKVTFSPASDSAPSPPSKPAVAVSAEVRQRIKEILSTYSHGLWAPALPKLFVDTYKTPLPEHILDNLSLLLDICSIEYPTPNDKKKAILYYSSRADVEATDGHKGQQCRGHLLPSGLEVLGSVLPPSLALPSEQYPSVLVTDAKSSNAVTIRYVGENYSNAQEAMENTMQFFYSQNSNHRRLVTPTVGQLVAIRGEDGDELARAQVVEVMAPNKVKVYYVDYGFSLETSGANLLELHQDFLSLPFQATNVRLAGLEAFSSHPLVLSSFDKLAIGKILLMETLEPCPQNDAPVVVLYDTTQDDDININSTCLRALQDKTMNNPLTVNVTYKGVCVTNVCPEGVIYCRLPSRGTARLSKLLEETEAIFNSQMTSESLVSRPFSGKLCLARYKGKWSRAEITNMYGNRVMEILFVDSGVPATVEVTDLREIPPLFFQDFAIIPPQATKCRLADLNVPGGDWSPEAVLWMKEAVLDSEDCKMKILKIDQHKEDWLVYMYLFIGTDSQELDKSINYQLGQSELWNKVVTQRDSDAVTGNRSLKRGLSAEMMTRGSSVPNQMVSPSTLPAQDFAATTRTEMQPLPMPPPLEFPQPAQNMDVFVPVACHPGHFVLQRWQDLHKLMVLMGEMILYYNQMWKDNTCTHIQKGEVYAAKIDKNWHRVQVKGILANKLVSVYELDHGKHELVHSALLRPLIEEFRQLPFQAITAQLAGVTQHQWSEEASMLFRNHVENRALVAQVESVQELSEVRGGLWERRLTVYLVDTALADRDLWIHNIMADIGGELSSAA